MLAENIPAPDFSAEDQNGEKHQLADYRGKWVLLYFYPKDNTPGCTAEACEFRDNFSDLKEEVTILGVSHDKVSSHSKFAAKYKLPFTLLSDPDKKLIKDYEANGLLFTKRCSYLINPEGVIAKVYDRVSPSKHAAEVLQDVKALKSAE